MALESDDSEYFNVDKDRKLARSSLVRHAESIMLAQQ